MVARLPTGARHRVASPLFAREGLRNPLPFGRRKARGSGRESRRAGCVGRGRESSDRRADRGVGHALPRPRKAHVVSLVHYDEPHAPGGGELLGMPREELRRGERDVERAVGQTSKALATLLGRALARENDHADTEAVERLAQMKGLVCDKCAQRIDEQAGFMACKRTHSGVHLERERLVAPRRHDAKHRPSGAQMIEHLSLSVMQ